MIKQQLFLDQGLELSNSVYMCVCKCVCMNMHVGCECNVVIATCPQRYLESTFLRCDNVAFTTFPQPKHNIVTTLSQRDFVGWEVRNSKKRYRDLMSQPVLLLCLVLKENRGGGTI